MHTFLLRTSSASGSKEERYEKSNVYSVPLTRMFTEADIQSCKKCTASNASLWSKPCASACTATSRRTVREALRN